MTAKFLATETDRLGSNIEIYQSPSLDWSPAFPLFLKTYLELMEKDWVARATMWNKHSCGVVYAKLDHKVVAAVAYDPAHHEFPNSLWIVLWCVDPAYRSRGLIKILHKYSENVGRELGKTSLLATGHIENVDIARGWDSVGYERIHYLVAKKI